MRKTKYNKGTVDLICSYIKEGDSQKLACRKSGIGDSTFHEWINAKPEFAEAIKKSKDEFLATIAGKLEATLWKRAMGYEVTETETEYISDEVGQPRIKGQKTKVKHIQPDTGALIFALTNVAPDRWVNKQRVEQDVKAVTEQTHNYCFEDLPKDMLFEMADKLQAAEHDRVEKAKEGEDGQE